MDEVTFRMVPDQDQAVNLLTTNEIQVIPSVALPKIATLKENTKIQVLQVPEPYRLAFSFLLTKTDAPPWDNTKVRQALNWALDRKAMLAQHLVTAQSSRIQFRREVGPSTQMRSPTILKI